MRDLVSPAWVAGAVLLIVAGIVLLAISGGDDTAGVIGFALLGLGAVVGTSLAFYAVGRSEDRERAERDG